MALTPRTFLSVVHLSAKNTPEAPQSTSTNDLLSLGPHWPCNLLLNVIVTSSKLSNHLTVYIRSPTLQVEMTQTHKNISPFHLVNILSALLTPIVTTVHLKYQTTGRRAITSKEGPEPG
jgi:hypothetical protein